MHTKSIVKTDERKAKHLAHFFIISPWFFGFCCLLEASCFLRLPPPHFSIWPPRLEHNCKVISSPMLQAQVQRHDIVLISNCWGEVGDGSRSRPCGRCWRSHLCQRHKVPQKCCMWFRKNILISSGPQVCHRWEKLSKNAHGNCRKHTPDDKFNENRLFSDIVTENCGIRGAVFLNPDVIVTIVIYLQMKFCILCKCYYPEATPSCFRSPSLIKAFALTRIEWVKKFKKQELFFETWLLSIEMKSEKAG